MTACSACGVEFSYEEQRFCQECGATRPELDRYPVLKSLAKGYALIGWITGITSVVGAVLFLFYSLDQKSATPLVVVAVSLVAALIGLGWSLLLLAQGELITLFVDIERNTRNRASRSPELSQDNTPISPQPS